VGIPKVDCRLAFVDRAQSPEEVDPDDEVEAAEVEADVYDGERVSTNRHGHMARDALAREVVC